MLQKIYKSLLKERRIVSMMPTNLIHMQAVSVWESLILSYARGI